ncbi:MAG: hypothetical protein WCF26_26645, partial [Candidatus Sulfotelmatobacter sp.]
GERNVARPRTDLNRHAPSIQCRQSVLQADPEFANYSTRVLQLLLAFVLCQMLVSQPPTKIADVPDTLFIFGSSGILVA